MTALPCADPESQRGSTRGDTGSLSSWLPLLYEEGPKGACGCPGAAEAGEDMAALWVSQLLGRLMLRHKGALEIPGAAHGEHQEVTP